MSGNKEPAMMDRQVVLKSAQTANVRYVRLQFADLMGSLKNVEVPVHELEKVIAGEVVFDGSALDGFARFEESDMLLRPDLSTWLVFPWSTPEGRVARLICDVYLPDGRPFAGDPRGILKRSIKRMQSLGFDGLNVGLEVEFFLLRLDKSGHPVLVPNDQGGYFDISPLDTGENCRRDIAIALDSIGIPVEASHHEVARGQHEIDIEDTDALTAADNLMTMRMLIKTIARDHGLHATFMPKPFADLDGSGLHVHQALFKNGCNAFMDPSSRFQLSVTAGQYIAGLLHHAQALTAITNPLVNSYKRIVQGYDAPIYSAWSVRDTNAYVRVPDVRGDSTRVELRAADSACNPYLAFAAMLEAGLDGITRQRILPDPVHHNLFGISEVERFQMGVSSLPSTLLQALTALEEDDVVQGALGEHACDLFERAKWQEWHAYQSTVHRWEHEHYLDL